MSSPRPWTDADDRALVAHHAAGGSLHAFCADHGRAKSTVGRKAKALGLSFGAERTERTRVATEAAQATNAERRAAVIARMYKHADALLARVESISGSNRFRTLIRTPGGGQQTTALSFVPTEDARNLYGAVSALAGSAARLENVGDRGGDEAAQQKSMVLDLITALRDQVPS